MLKGSGVELAIITGRNSRVVEHRAESRHRNRSQGAHDKLVVYEALCRELGIASEANRLHGRRRSRPAGDAARRTGDHRTGRPELVKPTALPPARSRRGGRARGLRILMRAQGTLDAALAPY